MKPTNISEQLEKDLDTMQIIIDNLETLSVQKAKIQYHKVALLIHPDKCPASGWWCSSLGAPELVMALRSISGISLYSYGSSNEPHCGVLHATTHYQAGIGHIMSQNSQLL